MAKEATKKPKATSTTLPGGTKITGPEAAIKKLEGKPAVRRAASEKSSK